MRILFVDDSKAIHAYVKSLLVDKNIQFHSVYNGREALDYLRKDSKFDLIVLDWEMPVMTGPETLVEIKKQKVSVPVVMMTSKNEPSEMQQMLDLGAVEYILKPFTPDIFFEKIFSVIGEAA